MSKFNSWEDYLYQDTPEPKILKNKHEIKDQKKLSTLEYVLSKERSREGKEFEISPQGFKNIHKHLLGDTYEWAGENRAVGMNGYGMNFAPPENIDVSLKEAFKPLGKNGENLKNISVDEFSEKMADNIGYLNAIHPFREGNGRAMKYHLESTAKVTGFEIKTLDIPKELWNTATGDAANLDNRLLKKTIADNIKANQKEAQRQNENEEQQSHQYYSYSNDGLKKFKNKEKPATSNDKKFINKLDEVLKTYQDKSLSEQVDINATILADYKRLTSEEKIKLPRGVAKIGEKLDKKQNQVDEVKQDYFELKNSPHIPIYKKKKEEKAIADKYTKLDKKQKITLKKQSPETEKEINKIYKKYTKGKSRELS